MSPNDPICKINIGKGGISSDMQGLAPDAVANLFVFAETKSDLRVLSQTAYNRTVETGHALSLPEPERRKQPERYAK